MEIAMKFEEASVNSFLLYFEAVILPLNVLCLCIISHAFQRECRHTLLRVLTAAYLKAALGELQKSCNTAEK